MSITLEQLQYGFDRDSRRTWRQRATTQGWDNAYAYDSLSQVIGDDRGDLNLAQNAIAGIPSNGSRWQYDETGNWHGYQTLAAGVSTLNQARTHDKGNRLMEVSEAAAMRTDRAGRMLETVPGPDGDWSKGYEITWDAWSRITAVASLEEGTATPVATYGYDGLTRRITRYTNAEDVTLHSYYNDEWRPVEERREGSSSALQYLWGSRHRDDLVRRDTVPVAGDAAEDTHYVLMDYFSPAAVVDVSGDMIERYQFSAFGLRTILSPSYQERAESEIGFEFSFQGQFEDVETGWLNYGYRYYLPALGRWACKDPIGEMGGLNLYVLARNRPINWVDQFGLFDLSLQKDEATGKPVKYGNYERTMGGWVDQYAYAVLSYKENKSEKCWTISGEVIHEVFHVNVNKSPDRLKELGTLEESVEHEAMHIDAFIRRLEAIVARFQALEGDFKTEQEAKDKLKEYKTQIDAAINEAQQKESKHDTKGGFGTPAEGKPYTPTWRSNQ